MKESDEKLIEARKNKVHDTFADQNNLAHYLFETLDNFFYRYLETTLSKDLHTSELRPNVYGAVSYETMFEALKKPNPEIKNSIIEAAKLDRNGKVRFGLWAEVKELSQDRGSMKIVAEINWGHPDFEDQSKRIQKVVKFDYDELFIFRKQLALKLEEASELFG